MLFLLKHYSTIPCSQNIYDCLKWLNIRVIVSDKIKINRTDCSPIDMSDKRYFSYLFFQELQSVKREAIFIWDNIK